MSKHVGPRDACAFSRCSSEIRRLGGGSGRSKRKYNEQNGQRCLAAPRARRILGLGTIASLVRASPFGSGDISGISLYLSVRRNGLIA